MTKKLSRQQAYNIIDKLPYELQQMIYKYPRKYFEEQVLPKLKRPLIYECIDKIYAHGATVYCPSYHKRERSASAQYLNTCRLWWIDGYEKYKNTNLSIMYRQWAIDSIWQFENRYIHPYLGDIMVDKLEYNRLIIYSNLKSKSEIRYLYRFNELNTYNGTASSELEGYDNDYNYYIFELNLQKIYNNICYCYCFDNSPFVNLTS